MCPGATDSPVGVLGKEVLGLNRVPGLVLDTVILAIGIATLSMGGCHKKTQKIVVFMSASQQPFRGLR